MKQYRALLWINLASIPGRLGLVLTIVVGVACAVGTLVSMLAMGEGARRQMMGAVRADHVVLLSVGAQTPTQSSIVGSIMALAATLGAANSLYAVVDSRRRELATLRALGFRSAPIIASVMTEAILLSLPGAVLGVCLAWLLFSGLTASPFGITFQLAVTVPIAVVGITWALAMGLVGGLLPALRAARVPVTAALRAT